MTSAAAEYPHTHAEAPFVARARVAQRELENFDRMVPLERAGPPPDPSTLKALASTMNEGMKLSEPPQRDSPIPAGYTYLGQLIDHDLTSDRRLFRDTAQGTRGPVRNFSTPQLDLDCLYGGGPHEDPELYSDDAMRFALDRHDLRRHARTGKAYIKDARNDSNRIISQLHFAFAKFHNQVVDHVGGARMSAADTFLMARQVVKRHYQWIVLTDFLPRIVGSALVEAIIDRDPSTVLDRLKIFRPPRIPFEFSAAAFRFGHSMVRAAYALNSTSGQILTFDAAHARGHDVDDLRGFRPLPSALVIDWQFFFPMAGGNPANLQPARQINTLIAAPLFKLPVDVAESDTDAGRMLPYRNLHRGMIDQLPSGQEVLAFFRKQGVPEPKDVKPLDAQRALSLDVGQLDGSGEHDLGGTGISKAKLSDRLKESTPLWYYVLKEAALEGGDRLGFVGGRIVAEVLIGLLATDPEGVLRAKARWRPEEGRFGCRKTGEYGITDLLRYVTDNAH